MKFEIAAPNSRLQINAYGPDGIQIGSRLIATPFIIHADAVYEDLLPTHLEQLTLAHVESWARLDIDIFIIGTGSKQVFLDQLCITRLHAQKIGCEVMDTAAACRCYNVLTSEERAVAAALFPLRS